jgi:hypothetical protein
MADAFRIRNTREAEAIVRAIAQDSARVLITDHAADRMEERDIAVRDLFAILRTGHVLASPSLTPEGQWKCKVVKRLRDNRDAGAVTIIAGPSKLVVVTVEWEDLP